MTSATVQSQPLGWRARVRDSRVGTLIVLGLTALLVTTGAFLVNRPESAGAGVTAVTLPDSANGPAPAPGKPAPDFSTTTVDGKPITLSGYRGHPVWLTFGATWCAACRAEAPDIQAAYDRAKGDGLVVVAVYLSEDADAVRGYADRVGLEFPKIADPDSDIASGYRVLGIPVHFFIDRSGILRQVRTGTLNRSRMDAALAAISR